MAGLVNESDKPSREWSELERKFRQNDGVDLPTGAGKITNEPQESILDMSGALERDRVADLSAGALKADWAGHSKSAITVKELDALVDGYVAKKINELFTFFETNHGDRSVGEIAQMMQGLTEGYQNGSLNNMRLRDVLSLAKSFVQKKKE